MTIKSVLAIPYESRTTSPVPARLGHQNATLPADAWIAGGTGFRCGKELDLVLMFQKSCKQFMCKIFPLFIGVLYIPNGTGFLPSTLFPGEYEGTLM